ncbi:MAG: helix-turn-helix domain-containing protein [Desulfobacterales bacterium]|jgi:cytoskeletal protein RodZ
MNEDNGHSTYGDYLRYIRLKRNISLHDVSAATRIRPEILHWMEEGDENRLPDPIYIKGFIKQVAEAIGADPEEALRLYRAENEVPPHPQPRQEKGPARPASVGALLLALAVIALLVAGVMWFQSWRSRSDDAAPSNPTASAPKAPAEASSNPAPPVQPASPAPVEAPASTAAPAPPPAGEAAAPESRSRSQLALQIDAMEETWIKVIRDENPAEEYFLKIGDQLELNARTVYSLLIGNAGGVRLSLNGKPIPVPGKTGQVVTMQLP